MTKLTAHWLEDVGSQAICAMLSGAGHRALFVGGCVRNTLLGEPVGDIDLSTDATPEQIIALAEDAGLKPVPTGIDHGTITVVADGVPHEVTTFRRDVETDGRRAVVAYTHRVEEDAIRRDFTMNALYAEADGTLVDPLNGLPDLRARRVRFIEDPEARIREDYLRILRFFRFFAWYGDTQAGLDADGLAACAVLSAGLETLSKERIGIETIKLLSAPDPAPAVAAMANAGCLARILPGADPRALPILVHHEADLGVTPHPIRRLAALGGADQPDRLRLSRKDARTLATLRDEFAETTSAAELAYRHGADTARNVILLRAAMTEQPLPTGLESEIATGGEATFPLKAADLPHLEGPALGARLKELENRWIASGFTLGKAALLNG